MMCLVSTAKRWHKYIFLYVWLTDWEILDSERSVHGVTQWALVPSGVALPLPSDKE